MSSIPRRAKSNAGGQQCADAYILKSITQACRGRKKAADELRDLVAAVRGKLFVALGVDFEARIQEQMRAAAAFAGSGEQKALIRAIHDVLDEEVRGGEFLLPPEHLAHIADNPRAFDISEYIFAFGWSTVRNHFGNNLPSGATRENVNARIDELLTKRLGQFYPVVLAESLQKCIAQNQNQMPLGHLQILKEIEHCALAVCDELADSQLDHVIDQATGLLKSFFENLTDCERIVWKRKRSGKSFDEIAKEIGLRNRQQAHRIWKRMEDMYVDLMNACDNSTDAGLITLLDGGTQ
jgi:hypothetical protein